MFQGFCGSRIHLDWASGKRFPPLDPAKTLRKPASSSIRNLNTCWTSGGKLLHRKDRALSIRRSPSPLSPSTALSSTSPDYIVPDNLGLRSGGRETPARETPRAGTQNCKFEVELMGPWKKQILRRRSTGSLRIPSGQARLLKNDRQVWGKVLAEYWGQALRFHSGYTCTFALSASWSGPRPTVTCLSNHPSTF